MTNTGSSSTIMESLEQWWDVWSSRILVTLAIIFVWDWWQRRSMQQECGDDPAQELDVMTDQDLSTEPPPPPTTTTTTTRTNPLLGRFDQQQKESREKKDGGQAEVEVASIDTLVETSKTSDTKQAPMAQQESKKSKPASNKTAKATTQTTTSVPSVTSTNPPQMSSRVSKHPGMRGFCYWYEVETSLFRIYTMTRSDGVEVVPPYIPHSYRGTVPIFLHVTNHTPYTLKVYWVDYKGKHILKGTMRPEQYWTQTTWIDHPWVFEDEATGMPLLYYIPYRVIPTLPECPTVLPDEPDTGVHKFAICRPQYPFDVPVESQEAFPVYHISVDDQVLPHPPQQYFTTPLDAITWTMRHLDRMGWERQDPIIALMQKYLHNIIQSPEVVKYRHLRTHSSSKFGAVWKSPPLQGLLLAIGFVEVNGYAELGGSDVLPREWVQDVALLSNRLAKWQSDAVGSSLVAGQQQPQGADGFGRAGYGRVGAMGLFDE